MSRAWGIRYTQQPPTGAPPLDIPAPCSSQSPTVTPPVSDTSSISSQARKRRRRGKSSTIHLQDDEIDNYYQLGKMIPRLVHPFLSVHSLLCVGSLLYMLQHTEDDEVLELEKEFEIETLDPVDKDTIMKSFSVLIDHEPWIKGVIPATIFDRELLKEIEYHVSKGFSQAHSDDTSALKLSCIPWIQEDLREPLEPPLQTDTKAGRGFHHPVLAKLLCPGSKQKKLVEDPEYINELKLGNVSDEDFPTFCYKANVCNLDDLERGLFRGTFLQRTFRRIFTGPASVLNKKPGPATKRKCNADIIGLTQATPRTIAYAVVQAHLALSDKASWDQCDGMFSYRHFYESIVAVFEDQPELRWVKDTLNW